jgi:hypothetical protein
VKLPAKLITVFLGGAALLGLLFLFWRKPPEPVGVKEPLVKEVPAETIPAPASSLPQPVSAADPAEQKVEMLESILSTKNDNDPRLDSEFKDLDAATKAKMRAFYAKLPPESLNQKGTVVFLIGRSLDSPEDAEFLLSVLQEPPCLTLLHCASRVPDQSEEDVGNEVSLAYPQIVALRYSGKAFALLPPERRTAFLTQLRKSGDANNAALSRAAREALKALNRR